MKRARAQRVAEAVEQADIALVEAFERVAGVAGHRNIHNLDLRVAAYEREERRLLARGVPMSLLAAMNTAVERRTDRTAARTALLAALAAKK